MTDKPPVHPVTPLGWEPCPFDETDPGYLQLVRVATVAADMYALDAPPAMSRADVTRGQIAEGLALLLELGVIDIVRERLAAWTQAGMPMNRRRAQP